MYNDHMTTITIADPAQATNAAEWALKHCKKEWVVDWSSIFLVEGGGHRYKFRFEDTQDATLFALKWS